MDANRNGVLEPGEIPAERRRMFTFIARRYELDPEKPIPISSIRERMMRRASGSRSDSGRRADEKQSSGGAKSQQGEDPLVPGFGISQEAVRVPGFGERVELASLLRLRGSTGSRSGDRSSRSSREGEDSERQERFRRFAQYMLRRYDRDQSGALERKEWDALRERGRDPASYDRNRDGVITVDEIAARMGDYGRSRSRDSDSSGTNGSDNAPARHSYRQRSPVELLPEGLPDWFIERDANKDGQVAMAEYASFWSESKAGEFARLDVNGDGIITPQECLDAMNEAESEASEASPKAERPAERPSGGSGGGGDSPKPWWMSP
ncbi:MAG TPA: EF-hand domain-containing protein [Planctomycetaceae bacterium]|nr:EF-hand domain-containing protein [Planctomycetaceae bacterium]